MRLVLVGTSHRLAPVEVRERVALGEREAAEVARSLAVDGFEAVCLSTCNRTELYLASPDAVSAEELAASLLSELASLPENELVPVLYRLRDEAAALHLFRVAAGLDSLVPGEGEILGQVRTAAEVGSPGPVLDRVFRQALHAGKKVRSETAIGESPASVSSAAAALAQQVFGELAGRNILVIGAGKVSELAARNLVSRGATISAVVNRSVERAEELAGLFGARPVSFERAEEELARADVVVSSTSAPGFVLGRDAVEAALRARKGRPLFLIDLAVPRDLDPAIHELPGCYLYDIDDLEAVVSESLAGRRTEAARAEEIVAGEAERFRSWQASLDVVPAIASLRARAEEIRARELERLEGRLGDLSERDRKAVESLTSQIVNKLLHLPTVRMKEAAAGADGGAYADVVRDLFGLGDERAPENRQPRE
jgi:glutamyl-tRNA reductase